MVYWGAMSHIPFHTLANLLASYGYAVVFCGVMLESLGLPLPGESLMIGSAIYAATTHRLDIVILVAAGAAGAITGDQIGYFIGRSIGFRALSRWGGKIGMTSERINLGRFLFMRYGAVVVFFGRFVALLRTFAALLAGANRMSWRHFAVWNALGGITWTCLYGFGAYAMGDAFMRISGPAGIVIAVLGVTAVGTAFAFIKRNEARLMESARLQIRSSG